MKTLAWHQIRPALWISVAVAALMLIPLTWSAPVPGSLDTAFVRTNAPGLVSALAVQPDGRILAISTAPGFIANGTSSESLRVLLRLHPNGTSDTTFRPGDDLIADALAVQPDGNIVLAASIAQTATARRLSVLRLLPDGRRDPAFELGPGTEPDDYLSGAVSVQIHGLAVEPDGRILVCGNFLEYAEQPHPGVVRLHANGTVDTNYRAGTRAGDQVSEPRYQSDGRAVLTVWSITDGSSPHPVFGSRSPRLLRLNQDGTIDTTFRVTQGAGSLRLAAVQPDDRLICAGWNVAEQQSLTRLEKDGAHDPSYGPTVRASAGSFATIERVVVQPDGKAMVLGVFSQANGTKRTNIARFHADGSLDHSFDPGDGLPGARQVYYRALALHPDGGILVGGSFPTSADPQPVGVARLWGDASPVRLTVRRQGGALGLAWQGGDSQLFQVEVSEDLRTWSPWATLTNGNSLLLLSLPVLTDRSQVFRTRPLSSP